MNSSVRKEMILSVLVIVFSVFVSIDGIDGIDGATFERPCHSRARTPRHGSAVLIDHDSQVNYFYE